MILRNKKAFTLAEVLLTLAIIGVVAALTIPAVITKATKEQYVTGLKKAYNTLKSMEREAIREHGEMENWDWGTTADDFARVFETYLKPHFDILKYCDKGSFNGDDSDTGCLAKKYTRWNSDTVAYDETSLSHHYKFITPDGIAFSYSNTSTGSAAKGWFLVDVNGPKPPNKIGRDMFAFWLFPNKLGVKPDGTYNIDGVIATTTGMKQYCMTQGTSACTGYVLAGGIMDY